MRDTLPSSTQTRRDSGKDTWRRGCSEGRVGQVTRVTTKAAKNRRYSMNSLPLTTQARRGPGRDRATRVQRGPRRTGENVETMFAAYER